jgi:hypothetical protein
MKKLCLGTMIKLLYQARSRQSDRSRDVCRRIFAVFDCNIDDYSKELPSHLKSGHNPVPKELFDRAVDMTEDQVNWGVKQYILGSILSNKREALIRAIKDILFNDTDMLPTEVVGYPGFEKKAILDSDTFEESAVIASVLRYSALCDNKALASSIKEIPADYLDGFISGEPIYFIDESEDQDDISPLKRTLRDPLFDRIFIPAASIKIPGMANPATASVYYISPQNCKFRFRNMESFIISNIGSYVYSRARVLQIQNLTKNDAAVGSNAMLKFMKTYGSEASTVLGEILLYVFLEQVLDAPKIMSKIEISELNGSYISKSDGVHLLREEISGQPFHQLVFGASDITGNLNAAIDRAFGKIIQIENNYDDELKVIDNTRHQTIFDPEATRFMVDLMTPKRDGSYKPDMAFGAFLGYTIVLDTPETDSRKYGKAVEEQLKKDIFAAQPYLEKKIRENHLEGYSFYLYVLPFNDAPKEKESIIQDILSGGGAF